MGHGPSQPDLIPPETVSARHELRDARPGAIGLFLVCFVGMLLIVLAVAWGVLSVVAKIQREADEKEFPHHPLASVMPAPIPQAALEPEPQHDVLPRADLTQVQARERSEIGPDSWKWLDVDHRYARVPLQTAIELAVKNGLPNVLPATQPTTQPMMPPASSEHGPGGAP